MRRSGAKTHPPLGFGPRGLTIISVLSERVEPRQQISIAPPPRWFPGAG